MGAPPEQFQGGAGASPEQYQFGHFGSFGGPSHPKPLPSLLIANYSVQVVNPHGSLMSSNAFPTVILPPALALQLWAGYALLYLDGTLGNNYLVQYSTNLAGTNWISLLSLTNLSASPYLFLDPVGDAEPARFYRAFIRWP